MRAAPVASPARTARARGLRLAARARGDGCAVTRRAVTRSPVRRGRGRANATHATNAAKEPVYLLDYGAGNVRSVRNAVTALGFEVRDVKTPKDLSEAKKLIFPGVGAYGSAMDILRERGLIEPLREYVRADKPFLGAVSYTHLTLPTILLV